MINVKSITLEIDGKEITLTEAEILEKVKNAIINTLDEFVHEEQSEQEALDYYYNHHAGYELGGING